MIYGPDGKLIHSAPQLPADAPPNAIPVLDGSEGMADDKGRVAAFRRVMERQMDSAKRAAAAYEALMAGRASLASSDEYGDRMVMFKGKPTNLRIHKDSGATPLVVTDYTPEWSLSQILD